MILTGKIELNKQCGDALEQLARQKEVTLVWVPEYTGVPGNERADELARSGPKEACQGPEPFLGILRRYVNKALYSWAYKTLEETGGEAVDVGKPTTLYSRAE
ncbi:hypothetical protein NQ317_003026 [Molorchus minor]|uniref:RNase H type-1 domain-containing protein n=1 Tax=Molorchus minor TaxID=1323400 RepID=A0ABQ9JK57_9CUCU|nr:hypothetical protein NQ317_003026 [Molorchus minor]